MSLLNGESGGWSVCQNFQTITSMLRIAHDLRLTSLPSALYSQSFMTAERARKNESISQSGNTFLSRDFGMHVIYQH